jgi:hypothetical protein
MLPWLICRPELFQRPKVIVFQGAEICPRLEREKLKKSFFSLPAVAAVSKLYTTRRMLRYAPRFHKKNWKKITKKISQNFS